MRPCNPIQSAEQKSFSQSKIAFQFNFSARLYQPAANNGPSSLRENEMDTEIEFRQRSCPLCLTIY